MHPYKRSERVASLLQREIAGFLERDLKDPRLKKITITKVQLTDDLKLARIYYSLIGTEQEKLESEKVLNRAKGMIKRLIGERIYLRFVPELEFRFDQNLEYSQKIEDLIKKIHEQKEPNSED